MTPPFARGDLVCWTAGLGYCFLAEMDSRWDGAQWMYGMSRIHDNMRRATQDDISRWLTHLREQSRLADERFREALELAHTWAEERS